jgi:hypothetical protein
LASSDSCFRSGSFFIPLSNVYLVLLSRGLSNYEIILALAQPLSFNCSTR